MAGAGFSNTTDKGIIAFERELFEGAWKEVSIKKYDTEDEMLKVDIADVPFVAMLKLSLVWAIRALARALGVDGLDRFDAEWDSSQRALAMFLGSEAEHRDIAHREAAGRLQTALLSDGGTSHTLLAYDQEVDFGNNQLRLVKEKSLAADVATVGAQPHLKRIDEATQALAQALGRAPGQNRAPSRARRVRDATAACTTRLNATLEALEWAIARTPSGPARDHLEALRAPLLALLDRYPAPAESSTPPPAPPSTP